MRCEDCLPLIEEYFDGEVEGRTAEQMGLHLASCEDCAAALDALSFEQEVYARYDRGLEVSPALWARVSAEIAREPQTESPEPGRPFLSRLREAAAAALGSLAVRPALASSLALLVVGVTAGALWLSQKAPARRTSEVAVNVPRSSAVDNPMSVVGNGGANTPAAAPSNNGSGAVGTAPVEEARGNSREYATEVNGARARVIPAAAAKEVSVDELLRDPAAPKANSNTVVIRPDEHANDADDSILVNASLASASAVSVVTSDTRLLDPEEKDVARHVEQTQMLLRSFKNVRPSDDTNTVNVAYERNLSRKLLAENATLKLDAETRGDKDTRQVLDTIEPFLLDIANLREQPSREEVRSIKERVTKNDIIAALQVY
ncbi:MAG TPA: zf-HC2 domain-containing protein [Pyrinomonadaceae bacterium]|nr:zf-HC2 domain-containing protein [Pyrinomonadaceae bacterium]